MCFSLSALRLSRYGSVKSNLKLPLKPSRWLFNSDFLSEAIDKANFSYEPADDITLTPVKKGDFCYKIHFDKLPVQVNEMVRPETKQTLQALFDEGMQIKILAADPPDKVIPIAKTLGIPEEKISVASGVGIADTADLVKTIQVLKDCM